MRSLPTLLVFSIACTEPAVTPDDTADADRGGQSLDDTGTSGPDDTGEAEDDTGSAEITPAEGEWTVTDSETVSDDCGYWPLLQAELLGEGFTIADASAAGFSLSLDLDPPATVSCALSGADFVCDPYPARYPLTDLGFDVDLVGDVEIDGRFSDAQTARAEAGVEIDCEGAECDTAATSLLVEFPCAMRGAIDVAAP